MQLNYKEVEFGGQKVLVPEGGYYDRFHQTPDLDEVSKDPAAGNVDFFRRIPKQKTSSRVGQIWAPNFYYRNSIAQLLMAAPLANIQTMLPQPLRALRAYPGHGLVALSFFSYAVCDNDPYNEVSIAVIVRKPGACGSHLAELWTAMKHRKFYAHVLALPVDTEIARIRGVFGYQLPKWLAPIEVSIDNQIHANVADVNRKPDLALTAPLPTFKKVPSQSKISHNIMVHQVDGIWCQTVVQSNILSFSQTLFPRSVTLRRHGGPMTDLLNGLGAQKIIRLDVVKDVQLVLNMPQPINSSSLRL